MSVSLSNGSRGFRLYVHSQPSGIESLSVSLFVGSVPSLYSRIFIRPSLSLSSVASAGSVAFRL